MHRGDLLWLKDSYRSSKYQRKPYGRPSLKTNHCSKFLIRLILLVETIFIQQYFCTTTLENTGQLEVHSYHDQRLLGECYHNITTSLMQECLQHCLSDCLCKSFQICGGTCQLCSNTGKFQAKIKSKSLGCNRFEFEKWKILNLNVILTF